MEQVLPHPEQEKDRSPMCTTGAATSSEGHGRPAAAEPTPLHLLAEGDDGHRGLPDAAVEQQADQGSGRSDRRTTAELLKEIAGLRRRLETQPVIEQAKGVLIGGYGVDADVAFAVLVRCSQNTNTKLHALAANLVAAANQPGAQPSTAVRLFLENVAETGEGSPGEARDG